MSLAAVQAISVSFNLRFSVIMQATSQILKCGWGRGWFRTESEKKEKESKGKEKEKKAKEKKRKTAYAQVIR